MSSSSVATRRIARSAVIVMFAIVFSQLIGLLAKALAGSSYGTGLESEAFFAANRFSEILFNLVAGGALASAFIPTFTGLLVHEERQRAWLLASAIANLVLLVLTAVCLLAAIFAPLVVRFILAPGFATSDPTKEILTAQLLRIQLSSAVIFGLSGLVMGILNAHQNFFLPALAPAMYQLGWIFGILVLAPQMGINGLAWGVVLGALCHLGIQLPSLLRLPERHYAPILGWDLSEVREVIRLMIPRLIGVAVVQLNFLLNTFLASFLPEGSLAAISLAFPLMLMPQAAIAQSVAIAALPTFSAQYALGKFEELRSSLAATLRGVLLLAIPASVGLVILRFPVVRLVYQHSSVFTEYSVQVVAWALLWYGIGLLGHSLVEIVIRAFYAMHDTKTPVIVTTAAMALNLLLSILFVWMFNSLGWMPHGGLAFANSLATFLEMIVLLVLMRRRLGGLEGHTIIRVLGQSFLAAFAMGAALVVWINTASSFPPVLVALVGVVLGAVVYSVILIFLRNHETLNVLRLGKRFMRASR